MTSQPPTLMASVKELAEKYRAEFEETFDYVRSRSMKHNDTLQQHVQSIVGKFQSIEPEIKQRREEFIQCVQNVVILLS